MIAKTKTLISAETLTFDNEAARVARRGVECLRSSGYRDLATVTCEYHEGVLTLSGQVPTFYMKQVAQTLVRGINAVELVDNRLTVPPRPLD